MNTRAIVAEYRLTHWAQIMQRRKGSGHSVKAFCENAGIHENTYYYWQRKLREAACEKLANTQERSNELKATAFAEVKLTTQGALPVATTINHGQVSVEAFGVRITADAGYPADKLVYLMRAVIQS
jgi:transposase-like protein